MLTILNRIASRTHFTGPAIICAMAAAVLSGCTPRGPRALLEGERLLRADRATEAVRRLRTAVELLPDNAQAWNHLGLACHATRQFDQAAQAYQQALRVDPNLAVAHYNLGCLYLEQGDTGRAVDSLRSYIGLQPGSADGWRRLGQAYLRSQQWNAAEQAFTSADRLAPDDPETLNGLGVAYQNRRRYRDAWQCFSRAIQVAPGFAPAWLNLGVAAQQANAAPQAIQAYRHYVNLRPDNARALGLDATLYLLENPLPPPEQPRSQSTPAVTEQLASTPPEPEPELMGEPGDHPPGFEHDFTTPEIAESRPREANGVESRTRSTNDVDARSRQVTESEQRPRQGNGTPTERRGPQTEVVQQVPSAVSAPQVSAPSGPQVTTPQQTTTTVARTPAPQVVEPVSTPSTTRTQVVRSQPATQTVRTSAPPQTYALQTRQPPPTTNIRTSAAPLVRPVPSQRAAQNQPQTFWSRANPANWFGGDQPEFATGQAARRLPGQTGAAGASEAARPPAMGASAGSSRTTQPPIQRYAYLRPAAPRAGNRNAALPLVRQAIQEHRQGRLDAAISLYERAANTDPSLPEAHQGLAAALLQRGDLARALAASESALALDPKSATARLNFALALERAGYPADAAAEAQKIVADNPGNVAAHLLLGNLYAQRLNSTARASQHYRRVIELDPRHPQSSAIRDWLASQK